MRGKNLCCFGINRKEKSIFILGVRGFKKFFVLIGWVFVVRYGVSILYGKKKVCFGSFFVFSLLDLG